MIIHMRVKSFSLCKMVWLVFMIAQRYAALLMHFIVYKGAICVCPPIYPLEALSTISSSEIARY